MTRSTLLLSILLLLCGALAAAAAPDAPGAATPAERPSAPAERSDELVYGPILAEDPATRLEIKRLYRQIHETQRATFEELQQLYAELEQETDSDFRREIAGRIGDAKASLEITNIELHAEIARLNGDLERAAEFELALDQLRNPEAYRREPTDLPVRDPAVRQ